MQFDCRFEALRDGAAEVSVLPPLSTPPFRLTLIVGCEERRSKDARFVRKAIAGAPVCTDLRRNMSGEAVSLLMPRRPGVGVLPALFVHATLVVAVEGVLDTLFA